MAPVPTSLARQAPTLLLVAAGLGAAVVLWHVDPNSPDSPLPSCPLRWLTGLFCAGCGSTRALHALLHGDVGKAFAFNPLLVVLAPVMPLMAASAAGWWLPRWLDPALMRLASPRLWLTVLVGYSVARNLPWFPFTALAPG